MNLGFEYLLRNGLIEQVIEYPFSVFATDGNSKRIVSVVDKFEEKYSIKHWKIWECEEDQALPPMEEFYSDSWKDALPSGFNALKCMDIGIPDKLNNWRHPMKSSDYYKLFDGHLNDCWHAASRERWLWSTFVHTYKLKKLNPDLYGSSMYDSHTISSRSYPARLRSVEQQQVVFRHDRPKQFKIWNLWSKSMLIHSSTPGEFLFVRLEDKLMSKDEINRHFLLSQLPPRMSIKELKAPKMKKKPKPKKKNTGHASTIELKMPEIVIQYVPQIQE